MRRPTNNLEKYFNEINAKLAKQALRENARERASNHLGNKIIAELVQSDFYKRNESRYSGLTNFG